MSANPVIYPPLTEPYLTASLEEDALLMEESIRALGELDGVLQEVHRMEDTAGTLQNVILYAPLIADARPIDLYMLQAAAELASTGSDIRHNEISPSLERYMGRKPSVEGFRSWLAGIWKVIVEAVKRAWNAVASFLSSVMGTIPRLRFFLNREIERLNALTTEHQWTQSTAIGSELFAYSVRNKLPKDSREILDRMDVLSQQVEYYLGAFLDLAVPAYDDVALGLEHMDEGSLDSCLNMISDDVMDLARRAIPPTGIRQQYDARLGGDYVKLPDLPGDKTICIRSAWRALPGTDRPLERAFAIQRNTISVMLSKETGALREFKDRDFPTPSVAELVKMCNLSLSYCDYVERLDRSMAALRRNRDRIATASKDIVERADDDQHVNGASSRDVQYYHAAIRYNTLLTSLVATPCLHLSATAMRVARATLAMSKRVRESQSPSVKPA